MRHDSGSNTLNIFSNIGDHQIWTTQELKEHLKVAELAFMRDARSVNFYGQEVQYNSKQEIRLTILALRKEISRRVTGKTGRTKQVTFTTTSKGF